MASTNPTAQPAPLMLSVSGARGIVGRSMTPTVATRFAAAFGAALRDSRQTQRPRVVIGRDGRLSGAMLEAAAAAGLASVGCEVIRLGVVMTPTVGVMIGETQADGGMVVTASHNPGQWNGLKCLTADGVAPPVDQARRIIARYEQSAWTEVEAEAVADFEERRDGDEIHLQRVLDAVPHEAIARAGFTVVLDSVNASGCRPGRMLLERLGVTVIHLNGSCTGRFARTPEPIREHLDGLMQAVIEHGADVGFAQDPDGDRLALVNERGEFIGEEFTLALAARRLLEMEPASPRRTLVANLSTSRMIDDLAEAAGARVVRSAVGEANVVEVMKREHAFAGGEGNGGVIWPRVCLVRDSLTAMALTLSLMAESGGTVSELASALPAYVIGKAKVEIRPGLAEAALRAVERKFAGAIFDLQDGIRADFPERRAWVHVRPSNTEPILRIIAEAPDEPSMRELLDETLELVRTL